MIEIKPKKSKKKAVSLMLSYVILISIAVIMSVTIFAWLRIIDNIEPVASCKEGTSIIISDYSCSGNKFNLTVKNNGRFNVYGFVLTVGNNTQRSPLIRLIPFTGENITTEGYLLFSPTLIPGNLDEVIFSNSERKPDGRIEKVDFNFIRNIRIQPFAIDDNGEKIFCDFIIRQNIEDCKIKE